MKRNRHLLILVFVLLPVAVGVLVYSYSARPFDPKVEPFSVPGDKEWVGREFKPVGDTPSFSHPRSVALNHDGSRAALWDAKEGDPESRLFVVDTKTWQATSHPGLRFDPLYDREFEPQFQFTSDDRYLILGQSRLPSYPGLSNRPLQIWDLSNGTLLRERSTGLSALSADNKTVVTVERTWYSLIERGFENRDPLPPTYSMLAVWDTSTWKVRRAFKLNEVKPRTMAVSPDGSKVVLDNVDYGSKLDRAAYDTKTGSVLWSVKYAPSPKLGSTPTQSHLVFSPDGQLVVAGIFGGRRFQLSAWNATNGNTRWDYLSPPLQGELKGLGFTPDGKTIFAGTSTAIRTLSLMNPGTSPPSETTGAGLQPPDTKEITAFGLSGDGKTAVIGGQFGNDWGIRVIDVATREVRFPATNR